MDTHKIKIKCRSNVPEDKPKNIMQITMKGRPTISIKVDTNFTPSFGELYYFIAFDSMRVFQQLWTNDVFNNMDAKNCNCFKTRKEAYEVISRIQSEQLK